MPDMSDDDDDIKKKLNQLKPKKNKLAIPEEFLDNAKSYEDKLVLVKMLTEKEKNRMILIIKNLLKDAVDSGGRK